MNKTVAIAVAAATAALAAPAGVVYAQEVETSFSLNVGARTDNMDWSTTGDPRNLNPSLRTSVSWEDLQGLAMNVEAKAIWAEKIVLRGTWGTGRLDEGDSQETTYFVGGAPVASMMAEPDNSDVTDASAAIGYQFSSRDKRTRVAPMVGYQHNKQSLRNRNGYQTDPTGIIGGTGPILGLDDKYDTTWRGGFVGVEVSHAATDKFTLYGSAYYHSVNYELDGLMDPRAGEAHPRSVLQEANATGTSFTVGGTYAVAGDLRVNAGWSGSSFSTDGGQETTFFADGQEGVAKLDEAKWDSNTLFVGVQYVHK